MIYQIKNNQNVVRAEIEVGKGIFSVNYFDEEFRKFLEIELERGVSMIEDVYDKDSKTFMMTKQEVGKNDPMLGFAVLDFLRLNGFKISLGGKEIDNNVRSILDEFSDDNEDKKDLLNKFPQMSYLEKSLLLRELKK